MPLWPYPLVFAHRLGGALAPENTLAGLLIAARLGVRAVECDVKLSADGEPFLLHDDTLQRTTNGAGPARALTLAQLRELDAGSRFHAAFAGEALPLLEELATLCRSGGIQVNLEIKPCPGREAETGRVVARAARRLWQRAAVPPLLSSFSAEALHAARIAAPELPRGLLFDTVPANWRAQLDAVGALALHCHHASLNLALVESIHSAGYAVMAYTVNDVMEARLLQSWGVDMLCTDRPDRLGELQSRV
ncbi:MULTISPECIES: glycerophosphodiester phosphodiesterase [Pseudogulbenkiania]|uniref:Glycerophosphodiester phosphodiesterase n=1 Tax=Pseudogulbenkiania ferrooxidans 2002 TaxID=279714 RepID=B9Z8U1_9NEIS|nr:MULTISPECIES: glycerophosphodiester phosphodiesterase [Pseudogulbenkiania]EEG06760.1 Glycerophosphodiester phosphodiesterase [Pseudogulbenkiania ferrooxidans 2002]